MKRKIISEKAEKEVTVNDICKKYRISSTTFYNWKRKIQSVDSQKSSSNNADHNYEFMECIIDYLFNNLGNRL